MATFSNWGKTVDQIERARWMDFGDSIYTVNVTTYEINKSINDNDTWKVSPPVELIEGGDGSIGDVDDDV